MLLSEVLASLSNETEHVSDMVQLDHAGRLVLVVEPGMTTDEAVAFEASRTHSGSIVKSFSVACYHVFCKAARARCNSQKYSRCFKGH